MNYDVYSTHISAGHFWLDEIGHLEAAFLQEIEHLKNKYWQSKNRIVSDKSKKNEDSYYHSLLRPINFIRTNYPPWTITFQIISRTFFSEYMIPSHSHLLSVVVRGVGGVSEVLCQFTKGVDGRHESLPNSRSHSRCHPDHVKHLLERGILFT